MLFTQMVLQSVKEKQRLKNHTKENGQKYQGANYGEFNLSLHEYISSYLLVNKNVHFYSSD